MMQGLSLEQFARIVDFVQQHHRFALVVYEENREKRKKDFPNLPEAYGFSIKYVDSIYDSRFKEIWSVSFRQGNWGIKFETNHFAMHEQPKDWPYETLYDLCMAYLKGDFKPTHDFEIDLGK